MARAERLRQALLHGPRLGVVLPLVLVTGQMIVNYKAGAISDLYKLYFTHHLYTHPVPYLETRIEYPVLIGVYMTAAAALTHSVVAYMQLSSIGLWLCALGCTVVLWTLSRRAAWWFAICPLLCVYSLLNWDLLAILLMLLGWRAWRQVRYPAAAFWFTLGVFTKFYPVVLLVFCLVEIVKRTRSGLASRRDLARFCGVAVGVGAVVNVPFMLLAWHNWLDFWSFSDTRNDGSSLLSYLPWLNHGGVGPLNAALTAILIVAGVAGAVAIFRGTRTIEVACLFFFLFMLLQKVYSPQYTLWLVAFALLAEWDFWTLVLLSMMGLTEYGVAVVHIALVAHRSSFVVWFGDHIVPLNKGFRLASIAAVALAMAARGHAGTSETPPVTMDNLAARPWQNEPQDAS